MTANQNWQPPPVDPDAKAKPPGIAMIVVAGIMALLAVAYLGLYAVTTWFSVSANKMAPNASSPAMDTQLLISGTLGAVMIGLMLLLSGFTAWGGYNLMTRNSRMWALVGLGTLFVQAVPCSCCPVNTVLCLPVAIWALVVLVDSSMKDAFLK